jgi:type IV pilus assembly protein PilB
MLTQVLSQQLSVPWVSLNHIDFSRELLDLIPLDLAEKYCLVPIYVRVVRGQGDTLYVAMEDPMNEEGLRDCAAASGLPARAMIAAPSDIFRVLRMHYGSTIGAAAAASALAGAAAAATASGAKAAVGGVPPSLRAAPAPRAVPSTSNDPGEAAPTPAKDERTPAGAPAAPTVPVGRESHVTPTRALSNHPEIDDGPSIESSEVDLAQRRKRGRQLTLLDGTTIKLPTEKKRVTGRRRSEPSPSSDVSAADVVAALRAAAHGVDSSDVLGESLRWEKMMAALLTLLLRKHLILERELLDELKKI